MTGQVRLLERIALGAPLPETLSELARLMEASFGDGTRVALYSLDDAGELLLPVAAPSLPAAFLEAIREGIPLEANGGIGGCSGCLEATRRREPVLTPDLASIVDECPHLGFLIEAGLRSCWATPVSTTESDAGGGTALGTMSLWYPEVQDSRFEPSPAQKVVIRFGTHLARIALERARSARTLSRLYDREKRIAETLQRSLLVLPEVKFPALEFAYHYAPARNEALIGGDFYDVFRAEDGRVAFVVGDLTGKGLEAAAATAEVKFTLRAFLREYPDPAAALWRLNRSLLDAQRLSGRARDNLVAVAVAVLDLETGTVHLSSGGSEPVLLLRQMPGEEGRAVFFGSPISGGRGPLLGTMPEDAYPMAVHNLSPGDALVLFTDGLTEARRPLADATANGNGGNGSGGDPRDPRVYGWEAVSYRAAELCTASGADMTAVAQGLVDSATAFGGGHLSDDTCVLTARWVPETRPDE
ncbi:MAG TPA: PP2C family protein-serine/threonine phosphatase [Armatimonadaceae bacterium]|nr:PP2C family protein-serine/threonine phosphatase [Armatimonadaceae bacterium]